MAGTLMAAPMTSSAWTAMHSKSGEVLSSMVRVLSLCTAGARTHVAWQVKAPFISPCHQHTPLHCRSCRQHPTTQISTDILDCCTATMHCNATKHAAHKFMPPSLHCWRSDFAWSSCTCVPNVTQAPVQHGGRTLSGVCSYRHFIATLRHSPSPLVLNTGVTLC